jgi:hypothetical protein
VLIRKDHACATLPLLDDDGNIFGAVNLGFDDPHKVSAIERELIHVLGRESREAMALGQRIHNEIVRGRDSDR